MGWKMQGLNPSQARDFSLLQIIQIGFGPHPASYSTYTGVPSWGKAAWA